MQIYFFSYKSVLLHELLTIVLESVNESTENNENTENDFQAKLICKLNDKFAQSVSKEC